MKPENRIIPLGQVLLLISLIISGCSKHKDAGFTSAEGKWTYTTPDSKIAVNFDLVKSSTGTLSIENQTLSIDGTQYLSAAILTGVNLPTIQKITINANDGKAVFPYYIEFDAGVVSKDFKTVDVPTASYSWPWGTTNSLTAIHITRRP